MEKKIANPGPLGLMGFSMTTILLNIHNMGFFPNSSVIIAMGITYGGISQIIAGIMDFKRGNTFGATAFTSYGFFWLSLVLIWLLPNTGWGDPSTSEPAFMGWYLFIWGMFSLFMFIGTLNKSKVMQFVFFTLVLLFMLLATANWTGSHTIHTIAGVMGVICGSGAFYLSMAELLEDARGKKILPY